MRSRLTLSLFFCGASSNPFGKAEKGIDCYTEKEFIFGRDNLKERPNDFIKKLEKEEKLLSKVIENDLSVKPKLHLIREVLNEN